jgi:NAD(P)-dependent dehydrogenase (short-subunit alcohol dehydrogenase family)
VVIPPSVVELVPESVARENAILPLSEQDGELTVIVSDPQDFEVIEKLRDVSVTSRTIQRDQVPEDVVGAVVFLCTPVADFITGQTMVIDGGRIIDLALDERLDGAETETGRDRP